MSYNIPITYTTVRNNPNFENIYPVEILTNNNMPLPLTLPEEEFVLLNIQGQGEVIIM